VRVEPRRNGVVEHGAFAIALEPVRDRPLGAIGGERLGAPFHHPVIFADRPIEVAVLEKRMDARERGLEGFVRRWIAFLQEAGAKRDGARRVAFRGARVQFRRGRRRHLARRPFVRPKTAELQVADVPQLRIAGGHSFELEPVDMIGHEIPLLGTIALAFARIGDRATGAGHYILRIEVDCGRIIRDCGGEIALRQECSASVHQGIDAIGRRCALIDNDFAAGRNGARRILSAAVVPVLLVGERGRGPQTDRCREPGDRTMHHLFHSLRRSHPVTHYGPNVLATRNPIVLFRPPGGCISRKATRCAFGSSFQEWPR
jgi:hypothetical protein